MAEIKKRSSFAGTGCLLQGLGLACLFLAIATFFSVIGPIIFGTAALALIIYGSRKAYWLECSECGTVISHKKIKLCPSCHSKFQ